MTDHYDWDRLARYVSGESGATERAEIERWAASSDSNRAMLESVKRRWNAAGDGAKWNVDAAWAKLAPQLANVRVEPGVVALNPRVAGRSSWLQASRLVPLAAAAGLIIAVALRSTPNSEERTTNMAASVTSLEMRTGVGEQRTVDLSDGSQVILGATSTLRVAEGYGTSAREVTLEGKAFIRVRHDASRPFIVNAGGTRTIDLGTAFEVSAYPNEGVRVAVTEGLVEVRRSADAKDSTVLQPGDIAEVGAAETLVRRQQDVERLLSWTRGELSFDDTPLSEVARELERWFAVQVRIEDPALRSLRWSAPQLRIGESLDTILELIQGSLSSEGLRAVRNGNVITFRSGPPMKPTAVPVPRRSRVEAGA